MATDALSRQDFEELAKDRDSLCVSIFLPTHRVSLETQEDRIRLDNLLSKASKSLKEKGMRHVDEFLSPGLEKQQDPEFWRHLDEGLALFITEGFSASYRLPMALEESVHIGEHFHIKPLLPMLSGNGTFYLLALSQNKVVLYRGSRDRLEPVELPDLPESLAWALRFDERESQLQLHTGTGGAGGESRAMFHGQGVGSDDEKERIERFCREVDKGLHEFLTPTGDPLVLAAVTHVAAIFKGVSTYSRLMDEVVEGNPEKVPAEKLQAMAWEIVKPEFEKPLAQAVDRFERLRGGGKTAVGLQEILEAAVQGKVESLFVSHSAKAYGRFDPTKLDLEFHEQMQEGDTDLVDEACRLTLLKGGNIYILPREQVPGGDLLSAVYRF